MNGLTKQIAREVSFKEWLFACVVINIILIITSSLFILGSRVYYRYAPVDNFYKSGDLLALDICLGDEHQSIVSDRQIFGTKVGYNSILVKELSLLTDDGPVEVYQEYNQPFVENKLGNQIIQTVPTNLKEGEYRWVFYRTIYVHEIPRDIDPPTKSNKFKVVNCATT